MINQLRRITYPYSTIIKNYPNGVHRFKYMD